MQTKNGKSIFDVSFPMKMKISNRRSPLDEKELKCREVYIKTSYPENFFTTEYFKKLNKVSQKIGE